MILYGGSMFGRDSTLAEKKKDKRDIRKENIPLLGGGGDITDVLGRTDKVLG